MACDKRNLPVPPISPQVLSVLYHSIILEFSLYNLVYVVPLEQVHKGCDCFNSQEEYARFPRWKHSDLFQWQRSWTADLQVEENIQGYWCPWLLGVELIAEITATLIQQFIIS